jgi:hypothetical protein
VEKLITIEEAAKRLGKTVDQIQAMRKAGQLRTIMSGGIKFKESEIAALEKGGAPAGDKGKEDTLMTIDADVLFAEGEGHQPADAAAETWIAADMESVFESDDFKNQPVGEEPLGRAKGSLGSKDLEPAPLPLSRESDDTSLGAVLMEGDVAAEEPIISIDPESGIATITSPTPGISRTRMIVVTEPEPRHKAFTPLVIISTLLLGFSLVAVVAALSGLLPDMVKDIAENGTNMILFFGGAIFVALIAGVIGYVMDKQKSQQEALAAMRR